jgi:hypothetical protein
MLPTEKTKPSDDPMSYSILLYGQTKAGKSTFASKADRAIFLATEPGLNALSVFKVDIDSWPRFLAVCKELATTEHEFKTIVIDTVDNAYDFCLEHVCSTLKDDAGNQVTHPADLGYGKGWKAVNSEFKRILTKLAALPQGLILISHSKVEEVKTRTGKYDRIVPTLGSGPRKILLGLMDLVLMVEVDAVKGEDGTMTHRRIIHTKPTSNYDAGDRTGKLPDEIPLDYDVFNDAFKTATKGEPK